MMIYDTILFHLWYNSDEMKQKDVLHMITWNPIDESAYEVFADGVSIGTIRTHRNSYHGRNCYLKLELERMDFDAAELFAGLYGEKQSPLHTMLPHPQQQAAEFLLRGGFGLRRRCFLMKVSQSDLIAPAAEGELLEYTKGSEEYDAACHLLYDQYARDHAAISPLTADFNTFCEKIPEQLVCRKEGDAIVQYAFLDENEVAYMGSEALEGFRAFAEAVLAKLFLHCEQVEFEADDIDEVAMTMRGLFTTGDGFSLDTYTYDPEFGKR